jgi:hypothetical protein
MAKRILSGEMTAMNKSGRIAIHAPTPEPRSSAVMRRLEPRETNAAMPGFAARGRLWLRARKASAACAPVLALWRAPSVWAPDASAIAAIVTQTHAPLLRFHGICFHLILCHKTSPEAQTIHARQLKSLAGRRRSLPPRSAAAGDLGCHNASGAISCGQRPTAEVRVSLPFHPFECGEAGG